MADIKIKKISGRSTITVSGDVTVSGAKELKEALLNAVRTATSVKVMLRNISCADVTVLQLLCAAHRTAVLMDRTLAIEGADREPMATLLRHAGFLRHIGCHDSTRRTCLWVDVLPEEGGRGQ